MKIKLHSQYNHFPNYHTEDDNFDLELWNDGKIYEYLNKWTPNSRGSALLIEPRSIQPATYSLVEDNYRKFDNIFTHDSQLLAYLPNAYRIIYWRDYELNDEPKTKNISFICGSKEMCFQHKMRMEFATFLDNLPKVDVLGDWRGRPRVSTHDSHAPYRFALIMENYYDDSWLTEKVLNAFANKTVPIYLGGRMAERCFDRKGILRLDNLWDFLEWYNTFEDSLEDIYKSLTPSIERNYKLVQKYDNFEDWFIQHYGEDRT